MDTLTMMSGGGAGGVVSSNAGYSGTPLWKLQQQGAVRRLQQQQEQEAAAASAAQLPAEDEEADAADRLRVAVDAVSLGRSEASGEKPLVRHVIVKDLRKVAARSKVAIPAGGLFERGAPVQLFGIFDGQSCAEAAGPHAAEWCAKQLLPKLLRNLSALPAGYENEVFIKATLKKTFEDLDKDILQQQPAIHDGCGAAVGLTVGEKLFTACLGKCNAVLCEAGPVKGGQASYTPVSMGGNQGLCGLPDERKWLTENGGVVFAAEDGRGDVVSNPGGAVAAVSRSLGDRAWKGDLGGIPGSVKLLRGVPETRSVSLDWAQKHQCLVLGSMTVAQAVSPQDAAALAAQFSKRPRATSGELASKAAETCGSLQSTSVAIYFLPPKVEKTVSQPAAKKARKEAAESVRLRHIVVKYRDCGQPFDPVRNRPITRSREEAETILRRALVDLSKEALSIKIPTDANKAKLAALQPSPKYVALCKELSECTTAQKGGGMMGDLGWQSAGELARYGPAFTETAKCLGVGQWSDLTASEHGVHILQRIA